jgi:serine/threonine protein kinase/Tol biopolymer transport system component
MQPGTRVGGYEVIAKLGEGGMGEVYRARDTALQREVALKVLPESFAADGDRVSRFRREAQVLASLNHPHIAQIYGLDQLESSMTLVMELVTGETLEARLGRGAIPIDEALAIATQITHALEAAHDAGIVHRDLKPANIALRHDGTVKVLDFGLAKPVSAAANSGSGTAPASLSPTVTSPMSHPGVILGTAAYMAPEQARGRAVDQRADIWAFGCVLFEMLAGRRAFEADDMSLTLARILEREPDFSGLPGGVPSHVEQVIRLCLRKDPKVRLAHMSDVRLALQGALSVSDPMVTTRSQWWSSPVTGALGATLLVAAGWLIAATARPADPGLPDPVRLSAVLASERPYENGSNPTRRIALSPDGKRIVVGLREAAVPALYHRLFSNASFERIAGTEDAAQPVFSPDGTQVAFVAGYALKVVGLDGAIPRTIVEGAGNSGTVIWRDDELIYTVPARREVWRVPISGGTPQRLASPGIAVMTMAGVPESDTVLCGMRVDGVDRIDALNVSTGMLTQLLPNALLVGHTDSGHLIFVRDNALMAAAFDPDTGSVATPIPVARGFAYDSGLGLPQIAVSASGTLAYVVDVPAPAPTLQWVDRTGTMTPAGQLPARANAVAVSPGGSLALVSISSAPRRVVLWDMQRQVPTGMAVDGLTPMWHPDGRRFAIGRRDQLLLIDADDASETVLASNAAGALRSPTFSRDGSMLAYVVTRGQTSDIYGLITDEATPRAVLATPAFEHSPALSPDGKWLAYVDGGGGGEPPQVYVVRFPAGTGRRRVTTVGGNQPVWRQDGRALFYREFRDSGPGSLEIDLRVVDVEAGETLSLGTPKTLFPVVSRTAPMVSNAFNNEGATFHAAPDGSRFLMVFQTPARPLTEIAIVQHLGTELQGSASAR